MGSINATSVLSRPSKNARVRTLAWAKKHPDLLDVAVDAVGRFEVVQQRLERLHHFVSKLRDDLQLLGEETRKLGDPN